MTQAITNIGVIALTAFALYLTGNANTLWALLILLMLN